LGNFGLNAKIMENESKQRFTQPVEINYTSHKTYNITGDPILVVGLCAVLRHCRQNVVATIKVAFLSFFLLWAPMSQ
jgi:hypothetical protein